MLCENKIVNSNFVEYIIICVDKLDRKWIEKVIDQFRLNKS